MSDLKSKEKFTKEVEEEVTKLFESVLDYAQIACPTPDTFKALRAKVLRVGNNCIRTIKVNLNNYDMIYRPTTEDYIEVKSNKR